MEIQDKTKFFPMNLYYTHWRFQGPKPGSLRTLPSFSWSPFYSFLTNLWKFYMLIPSLSLIISEKSHYYCDRYKLIHLQLLFLSAFFPSINQLLGSKTLSHMVLVCNGWEWGDFKHLNSTFYLTIWLSDYGCCSLDRLKWNWALINVRNNSNLGAKHSMTGKAFCLKENWKL